MRWTTIDVQIPYVLLIVFAPELNISAVFSYVKSSPLIGGFRVTKLQMSNVLMGLASRRIYLTGTETSES